MVAITDPPPEEVSADLARLRSALDEDLPGKALDRNLLVATWNVRAFGDLTEEWESTEEDTPKRDLHSLLSIAEIISRFDVVALQEARENLKALRHLLKVLGPNWGLSLTDVTEGAPGKSLARTRGSCHWVSLSIDLGGPKRVSDGTESVDGPRQERRRNGAHCERGRAEPREPPPPTGRQPTLGKQE